MLSMHSSHSHLDNQTARTLLSHTLPLSLSLSLNIQCLSIPLFAHSRSDYSRTTIKTSKWYERKVSQRKFQVGSFDD